MHKPSFLLFTAARTHSGPKRHLKIKRQPAIGAGDNAHVASARPSIVQADVISLSGRQAHAQVQCFQPVGHEHAEKHRGDRGL